MPRCFLHAGTRKTGTSAIQAMLRAERTALLARGVLVPAAGMERGGRHRPLCLALCGAAGPRHVAAPEALATELAAYPGHDVVVSCESLDMHFDGAASPIVAFFRSRGYEVVVIVYLRPQDERINSGYVQNAKGFFGNHAFRDYAAAYVMGNLLMYSRWLDVPAAYDVSVDIRPYARAVAQDGVATDFLTAIGAAAAVAEPRVNEGAGPVAVAAARRAMAALAAGGVRLSQRTRRLASERLATLAADLDDAPFWGFAPDERRHVVKHFAGDNALFARAAWGCGWDEAFAPAVERACNALDPDDRADPRWPAAAELAETLASELSAAPPGRGRRSPSAEGEGEADRDAGEPDLSGLGRWLTRADTFPPSAGNLR